MGLKLYFAGSIRGGREDAQLYFRLVELLEGYGSVLTEHVANQAVLDSESDKTDRFIHDRDVSWLQDCDALIAEVTQTSLGVGYEIGRAVALGKPVLCLYRPSPDKRLSAMIGGAHNGKDFVVKNYKEEEAAAIIKDFISNLIVVD